MITIAPESTRLIHYEMRETWKNANNICKNKYNTQLATIVNQYENNFIVNRDIDLCKFNNGGKRCYIGLKNILNNSNINIYDSWKWISQHDLVYMNWGNNEPNNQYGSEWYGEYYYWSNSKFPNGYLIAWNDGDSDLSQSQIHFLCDACMY